MIKQFDPETSILESNDPKIARLLLYPMLSSDCFGHYLIMYEN